MKIDWSKVKEGITLQDVLKEENKELKQEIERLERIINKANDYISKIFEYNEETGEYYAKHTIDKDNIKELHDILRGGKE